MAKYYSMTVWQKIIGPVLESGSPAEWKRKNLWRDMFKYIFWGLIGTALASFLLSLTFGNHKEVFVYFLLGYSALLWSIDIISAIYKNKKIMPEEMRATGYKAPNAKAKEPTLNSAAFGQSYGLNFDLSRQFKLIYTLIFIALSIGLSFLIVYLFPVMEEDSDSFYWWKFLLLLSLQFGGIEAVCMNCVRRELFKYMCPECGWVNSMTDGGTSNYKSFDEEKFVKTVGAGTTTIGTVYANGKKVGSVQGYSSGRDVYQTYHVTTCTSTSYCRHCGYRKKRQLSSSRAIVNRHY